MRNLELENPQIVSDNLKTNIYGAQKWVEVIHNSFFVMRDRTARVYVKHRLSCRRRRQRWRHGSRLGWGCRRRPADAGVGLTGNRCYRSRHRPNERFIKPPKKSKIVWVMRMAYSVHNSGVWQCMVKALGFHTTYRITYNTRDVFVADCGTIPHHV